MPKYLFKGLDAASSTGPGPTLWFQSPTSFNDIAAQITLGGGATPSSVAIQLEITLNGVDFRPWPFLRGTASAGPQLGNSIFSGGSQVGLGPLNGGYVDLGPVSPMMGFRLNLVGLDTGTITVLLAIDQED